MASCCTFETVPGMEGLPGLGCWLLPSIGLLGSERLANTMSTYSSWRRSRDPCKPGGWGRERKVNTTFSKDIRPYSLDMVNLNLSLQEHSQFLRPPWLPTSGSQAPTLTFNDVFATQAALSFCPVGRGYVKEGGLSGAMKNWDGMSLYPKVWSSKPPHSYPIFHISFVRLRPNYLLSSPKNLGGDNIA